MNCKICNAEIESESLCYNCKSAQINEIGDKRIKIGTLIFLIQIIPFALIIIVVSGINLAKSIPNGFEKVIGIMFTSSFFYLAIIASFGLSVRMRKKDQENRDKVNISRNKYSKKEAIIHMVITFLIIFVIYSITIMKTTGIADIITENGYVKEAVFEETWKKYHSGSKGRKSYYETIPEKYYLVTSIGEVPISKEQYTIFRRKETRISTNDETFERDRSSSSAPTHINYYSTKPDEFIPVSKEREGFNLMKGSVYAKNISGFIKKNPEYNRELVEYPRVYFSENETYELARVIDPSNKIPIEVKKEFQKKLQRLASSSKVLKEYNPILYFVESDKAIVSGIKEKWMLGKQKDIIIVVGSKEYPAINWVEVIAWSDSEVFKTRLAEEIMKLNNISDYEEIIAKIDEQVNKSKKDDGYFQMSEKEYNELLKKIHIPLAVNLLSLMIISIVWYGLWWLFKYKINL